jgi:hypothetical protein
LAIYRRDAGIAEEFFIEKQANGLAFLVCPQCNWFLCIDKSDPHQPEAGVT